MSGVLNVEAMNKEQVTALVKRTQGVRFAIMVIQGINISAQAYDLERFYINEVIFLEDSHPDIIQ